MHARLSIIAAIFLLGVLPAAAQTPVCRPRALAAREKIPALRYACDPNLNESDEAVLAAPPRRRALAAYERTLARLLAGADWWATPVEDLNLCDLRGRPGRLSAAERARYESGEYYFALRGDERARVVLARDPCYQTGFGGATVFIVTRARGRVVVSNAIDGFFTRADFPLGYARAAAGRETIVEIATTSGGLNPTATNYYFALDPRTGRAAPKNLFLVGGRPTNRITSEMPLEEPEAYGLPNGAEMLRVIASGRLAREFVVFEDTFAETAGGGRRFAEKRFKWNGKFYE